jgi:putative glutamine amidotransferase
VNVALGGSLYPEIRDLPGRMNHRMPPDGTIEEKFALRHAVTFTEGGPFHRLFGATRGDDQHAARAGDQDPGQRDRDRRHAPDGTPEAVYVDGAPGFTLSVQWHPEYRAAQDPVSRPLFRGVRRCRAGLVGGQAPGFRGRGRLSATSAPTRRPRPSVRHRKSRLNEMRLRGIWKVVRSS